MFKRRKQRKLLDSLTLAERDFIQLLAIEDRSSMQMRSRGFVNPDKIVAGLKEKGIDVETTYYGINDERMYHLTNKEF